MKRAIQRAMPADEAANTKIRRRPTACRVDVEWSRERQRLSLEANSSAALMLCLCLTGIAMLAIATKHWGMW